MLLRFKLIKTYPVLWSIIQTKLVLIFQKHKIIFKGFKGDGAKGAFSLFSVKLLLSYSKKASVLFQLLTFMAKVAPQIQYTFKWLWNGLISQMFSFFPFWWCEFSSGPLQLLNKIKLYWILENWLFSWHFGCPFRVAFGVTLEEC